VHWWTFIHGENTWWIAHQVRRSTSSTRYKARHAIYYNIEHEAPTTADWVFYPTRWYGKPCRVEHHLSKALLIGRLERAGVPAEVIEKVRSWEAL
jgi:hypothetical protein